MKNKILGTKFFAISLILMLIIISITAILIFKDNEPALESVNSEYGTHDGVSYLIYFALLSLAAENSEWGVEEYHWKVDNVTDGIEYEFNNPRYGVSLPETVFGVNLTEGITYDIRLVDKKYDTLDWGLVSHADDDLVIVLEISIIGVVCNELFVVDTQSIALGDTKLYGESNWFSVKVTQLAPGNSIESGDIQFLVRSTYGCST